MIDEADVVWDAWHLGDPRIAAMPYHRACATRILPPAEVTPAMRRCGICDEPLVDDVLAEAFAALHARFTAAKGSVLTQVVTWRLAGREPARRYVAEHFQCILGKLARPKRRRPPEEELPALPGDTQPTS